MTFLEGLNQFEAKYKFFKKIYKLPELTKDEMLLYLSIAQANMGNEHRLLEKQVDYTMAADQNYILCDSNTNNLTQGILDIKKIIHTYAEPYYEIYKADEEEVKERLSAVYDYAKYYCLVDDNNTKKILFDATLVTGITLSIFYYQKFYLYGETIYPNGKTTDDNTTWKTYSTTAAGFGGHFTLPTQFNSLIIDGALAEVIPQLKENYLRNLEFKLRTVYKNVSTKSIYKLQ